jgi:hypothetical protein
VAVDKLSDAETTIEHSYTGVRTTLYRPIRPLTDSQESFESWILHPKGCVLEVLVNKTDGILVIKC